nr:hypothetical protein [uncultured organism]
MLLPGQNSNSLARDEDVGSTRLMPKPAVTSSATLFMAAKAYKNAMAVLLPQVDQPGRHHLNSPYALLGGFALELAFKAILRANGKTDDDLKALSHSIKKAHFAALEQGFLSSDPEALKRLVDKMQEPHAGFLMRYIPAGVDEIALPHPTRALAVLEKLMEDIESQYESIAIEMPR